MTATPQAAAENVAERWQQLAQRAEELGYCNVLMPDGMQLPSPVPTLAAGSNSASAPGIRETSGRPLSWLAFRRRQRRGGWIRSSGPLTGCASLTATGARPC